jgi:hypothetical protein
VSFIPFQILLTGEKGVGKQSILNLFPGENIIEIDLDLNEILKKPIEFSKLEIEDCTLRVINLNELIDKFNSFKNLLASIDIICIVSNSSIDNLEITKKLFSNLKEKVFEVDFCIIANFQDRKEETLKVEKIEELLGEKTFGFSAVQKDSKEKIFSIIEEIIQKKIKEKEEKRNLISKYSDGWSEIENAKIFETQGDKIKVLECFSNAASQFQRLSSKIDLPQERGEIEGLYHISKALELMSYAQEKMEPKKFLEASNHFIQASEIISDNKLKLLALGNSEFCKALNIVTDFEIPNKRTITKDNVVKIKEIFNKMADLYKRGGFVKELEWALATSLSFDEYTKDLKET